ncbi:hypothetical protein N7520_007788 [Penicillium odoratum]|uniref:uncharacterized protein n=1 Tax=Penicillium odoratum TaxID=1167516 RepID=UPI00254741C8|nr:uncharacterized protein N7520_007788 [Penicillium odoratum]KAJ5760632.1 hypothetical protein N7520_007788 [Penicillium odoratum]
MPDLPIERAAPLTPESEKYNDYPLTETTAPPPVEQVSSRRESWPTQAPQPTSTPSKHATHLYTISYLIFFAIFGTLARLGLQSLTFYPGAPVLTSVLWANVAGSLVMGFLIEDRNIFREAWGSPRLPTDPSGNGHGDGDIEEWIKKHKATKKTIPLYIGLTTGFCGCCTSFSSFIRDVFLALANALPDPSTAGAAPVSRNGGYSFMALVAVILVTVSLSLSALTFGAHLAVALGHFTPTIPFKFARRVLDPCIVVLGWGCWLGAVFLAIWPPDRNDAGLETWRGRAAFAIVFAPVGCLLRFYVSLYLNNRVAAFPLGTFAVNMFGTVIEGVCYDLQHVSGLGAVVPAAWTGCQVLQGVMDGFCGSTTTISTWVAELNGLGKRRHAYFYGITSVVVGLGLLIVIMGSLLWTRGFDHPVCG